MAIRDLQISYLVAFYPMLIGQDEVGINNFRSQKLTLDESKMIPQYSLVVIIIYDVSVIYNLQE